MGHKPTYAVQQNAPNRESLNSPHPWHSHAGGGAVHSIKTRLRASREEHSRRAASSQSHDQREIEHQAAYKEEPQ